MHIIGGKYKKRPLETPKSDQVRPSTSQLREAVFNICQLYIEGAKFLDVFAGSGSIGLEALSRGASHSTFIENHRPSLVSIGHNIANLGVGGETRVVAMDALKGLQKLYEQGEKFDIIYVDPPYGKGLGATVLAFLDAHLLLEKDGSLFIEDTHYSPATLGLLTLHSKRRVGRAMLCEYRIIPSIKNNVRLGGSESSRG